MRYKSADEKKNFTYETYGRYEKGRRQATVKGPRKIVVGIRGPTGAE